MTYCIYRQYGDEEVFLYEAPNYRKAVDIAKDASNVEKGVPVEITYEDGEHKEFWLSGQRIDDLVLRNALLYHVEHK